MSSFTKHVGPHGDCESPDLHEHSTTESRTTMSNPVTVTLSNVDNASFGESDDERRQEVARLLRDAADKIECGAVDGRLLDYNGNAVGNFTYTPRIGE